MPAPYACGRTGGGGVQAPRIHGYIGLESIWSLVYQLRPFRRFFFFLPSLLVFFQQHVFTLSFLTVLFLIVVLAAVHGPCRIIGISICLSERHNLIMASSNILALPGHQDGVFY